MSKRPPSHFFSSTRNLIILASILLVLLGATVGICSHFIRPHHHHLHHANPNPSLPLFTSNPSRYAVIRDNFPDPCIVSDGENKYYAFATGNFTNHNHIQVASAPSTNLSNWTLHQGQDAMPIVANWVCNDPPHDPPAVWAPAVVQRYDGTWMMYYSAAHYLDPRRHCVGAALSNQIQGPYQAVNTPIVCNFRGGGAIDPTYFFDPLHNTSHLIYKQDGNAIGSGGACSNGVQPNTPTPLVALKLHPDTLIDTVGPPVTILTNVPSDGPNIEGPAMWYSNLTSSYHLMYASGCYADESYNIKHIVCLAPANPFDGPGGISNCSWQRAESRVEPFHSDNGSIEPWRMSVVLSTFDRLLPSVSDSLIYAPGAPDVLPDGSLMVFHGDLNPNFFSPGPKDPIHNPRVRGMYVMQLKYPRVKDRLALGALTYDR